jgi:protein TonB
VITRITVGGNVEQARLVHEVLPAYPSMAKDSRVQGTVRLDALIAPDGTVEHLTATSGHPLLVPAAINAVRQWIYRPTLLNGKPVEVETDIDVVFKLAG